MAVYTAIDNPEAYFQVKTYTGTGSSLANTLDGDTDMQPDLVWIKARDDAESNKLYDAVRGTTKHIESDTTDAEATEAGGLTAFGSDGFTVGDYSSINNTDGLYVAWCWKESATSGFDIVSYTGNATNRTISHSLSAVPKMIIIKDRDVSDNWNVYNSSSGNNSHMHLNLTNAASGSSTYWNTTTPTSSVFSLGSNSAVNNSSSAFIAYLFAEKQGFSKFGSYVGNGSSSGPMIWLGFRPAYVMIKKSSASGDSWTIMDSKRFPYNYIDKFIYAEETDAESGAAERCDFLSNGIKIRATHSFINTSGATYIYMCFSEAPFVNSNGVPCNAR